MCLLCEESRQFADYSATRERQRAKIELMRPILDVKQQAHYVVITVDEEAERQRLKKLADAIREIVVA